MGSGNEIRHGTTEWKTFVNTVALLADCSIPNSKIAELLGVAEAQVYQASLEISGKRKRVSVDEELARKARQLKDRDPSLKVKDLARELGVSYKGLRDAFKRAGFKLPTFRTPFKARTIRDDSIAVLSRVSGAESRCRCTLCNTLFDAFNSTIRKESVRCPNEECPNHKSIYPVKTKNQKRIETAFTLRKKGLAYVTIAEQLGITPDLAYKKVKQGGKIKKRIRMRDQTYMIHARRRVGESLESLCGVPLGRCKAEFGEPDFVFRYVVIGDPVDVRKVCLKCRQIGAEIEDTFYRERQRKTPVTNRKTGEVLESLESLRKRYPMHQNTALAKIRNQKPFPDGSLWDFLEPQPDSDPGDS